jgi:inosose dehydratase
MSCSRRQFLQWTGAAATLPLAGCLRSSRPNPIGYAMISFPDEQFVDALPVVANLGYKGVQIRADVFKTYSSKPSDLKEKLDKLKLQPVALSFPSTGLDPVKFNEKRDETTAKFHEYAAFHRQIGGTFIQLIDGGNPDTAYSNADMQSFGQYLNELGKIASDSGLTLSYHPHLASIGETREGMDRILGATDPRYLKLQPDIGHMTLGGMNPIDAIHAYRDRLAFFHFKDAVKEVALKAHDNRPAIRKAKVRFCEVGHGAVDYPAVIRTLDEVHFTGWIVVELDAYQQPPGGPSEAARINQLSMRQLGFTI